MSNSKLIDWLDISPWEQKHMRTIIGPKEKNRRKKEAYHKDPEPKKQAVKVWRRKNGIQAREEYLKQEADKSQDKLEILKRTMDQNPGISNRKAAKIMGVSESYVRKLKTKL